MLPKNEARIVVTAGLSVKEVGRPGFPKCLIFIG